MEIDFFKELTNYHSEITNNLLKILAIVVDDNDMFKGWVMEYLDENWIRLGDYCESGFNEEAFLQMMNKILLKIYIQFDQADPYNEQKPYTHVFFLVLVFWYYHFFS